MDKPILLLNMGVVIDVILAITVVAVTPGAVTKLKLGVAQIGSSADSTLMGVRCFDCGSGGFIRACCGKLDGRFVGLSGFWLLSEQSGKIRLPGDGDNIADVLAEE